MLPVDGPGELRTLATMPESIGDLAWSPDGAWLGFVSRTRDARYDAKDERSQPPRRIDTFFTRLDNVGWIFDRPAHVYVVRADGTGAVRNLTPGPFQHHGVAWLADSSGVVTSAQRHEGWDRDLAEDLYVVPLDGAIRALTKQTGSYRFPAVSPDGSTIAFIGADDPMHRPAERQGRRDPRHGRRPSLGLRATSTGRSPRRPARGRRCGSTTTRCSRRPRTAATPTCTGSSVDGGPPEPVTHGRVCVQSFDARGGRIVTAQATVAHPAEIVTLDGPLTNVTRSLLGWEKFAVPTTDGTDEIDAWIMRPAGFEARRKYPVLLNVHGGPFTQYGETFFDEAQMQAAAGFVVLMSQPARRQRARHGVGSGDQRRQAPEGARHRVGQRRRRRRARRARLRPRPLLVLRPRPRRHARRQLRRLHGDAARRPPRRPLPGDLLRAGRQQPASRRSGAATSAPRSASSTGPTHIEDPDEYARMSPIRDVRNIDVPMLILHSENDLRCPIAQAEELFMALRLLGKDVTFYRFPGEGHELTRSGSPLHRRMRGEIILDFFTEKLAPRRKPRADAGEAAGGGYPSASQALISVRAIEMPGGMFGIESRRVPLGVGDLRRVAARCRRTT